MPPRRGTFSFLGRHQPGPLFRIVRGRRELEVKMCPFSTPFLFLKCLFNCCIQPFLTLFKTARPIT